MDRLFLDNIAQGSVVNAMSEIINTMSDVQQIFASTDFDGDGTADSIQPIIASLEILTRNFSDEGNITITDFLNLWSQEDHSGYCLALLFTFRDFEDGVMGASWLGQPIGGAIGGICQERMNFAGTDLSLNSGIVTFLNFGQTQPRLVTTLAVAHEIGHGFGAEVRSTLKQGDTKLSCPYNISQCVNHLIIVMAKLGMFWRYSKYSYWIPFQDSSIQGQGSH